MEYDDLHAFAKMIYPQNLYDDKNNDIVDEYTFENLIDDFMCWLNSCFTQKIYF
jgi:hypothetical protein